MRYGFLFCFYLLLTQSAWAQHLPEPSGRFHIGHSRYEWIDKSRREFFEDDRSFRRVAADIWYPADAVGEAGVKYLDTNAIIRALGAKVGKVAKGNVKELQNIGNDSESNSPANMKTYLEEGFSGIQALNMSG